MPEDLSPADREALLRLAAAHQLDLDPASLRTEEMGLDFRVAFGRTVDGEDWVLRIPRRPDVLARAEVEGRLLDLVRPRLDVAVPDWQVRSEELIAYPLLPGEPGLSLTAEGGVTWTVPQDSRVYAAALGDLLAQLHAVDADAAARTGVEVLEPHALRPRRHADLERVAAHFSIAPALRERWEQWLADDALWPDHTVLTHGEIYPAHTLVRDERITAVLDWTTAAVTDPATDLMFLASSAPQEVFEVALEHYTAGGGRPWPRIAEHCAAMLSASPLAYGLYALETGEEEHRAAAAAALDPPTES
ncbi:macrolide 2'-phosphotransferase [Brachybacterium saurashtrense]|nr:macrolide 2'-phosphotransferase [Brachybacterium saurashtrense]